MTFGAASHVVRDRETQIKTETERDRERLRVKLRRAECRVPMVGIGIVAMATTHGVVRHSCMSVWRMRTVATAVMRVRGACVSAQSHARGRHRRVGHHKPFACSAWDARKNSPVFVLHSGFRRSPAFCPGGFATWMQAMGIHRPSHFNHLLLGLLSVGPGCAPIAFLPSLSYVMIVFGLGWAGLGSGRAWEE